MATTSTLQDWKDWLFKTGTNAQGKQVYVNPDVQKIWDTFKNEQALNKQTPRISTASESIENAQAALDLSIDARQRNNRETISHAYDYEPLKNLSAERQNKKREVDLFNQAKAFNMMKGPTLEVQKQMVHNRSNVDLPALIALRDRELEAQSALNNQIANNELLGKLLQGAGMLGVFLS